MHLDDEQIERLRHGELPWQLEKSIREHLAGCRECSSRVAEAGRDESEVYSLLRVLDRPPPPIDANVVVARARRATVLGRWRWAASLFVAAGVATAAFAAPGSPLRGWVREAVGLFIPLDNPRPAIPDRSQRREPALSGVAVAPGRELLILFTSPQVSGDARVSFTDGAEVVVRTLNGAATFTAGPGRLLIDNRSSTAMFEIQIPRMAPRVEIRVNGARVFLKDAARVTSGVDPDPRGVYVIRLSQQPGS